MPSPFPTVCVAGLGTAFVARIARTDRRVIGVEMNPVAFDRGRGRVEDALATLSGAGGTADAEYLVGNGGYAFADLVIEAVPEQLDTKIDVQRQADARCRPIQCSRPRRPASPSPRLPSGRGG